MMRPGAVAVVTGAGSGIGAQTASLLGRDHHVWVVDLDREAAARVAGEIEQAGGRADALELDVADPSAITAAFTTIAQASTEIDVLVNCAGVIRVGEFDQATPEEWELVHRVNVVGTYLCLRAALPALRAAPGAARVINVASTAGKLPGPMHASYNASKAAVISLTRTAAAALAPDVLVNCVCPGLVDTPMWRKDIEPAGAGLQRPMPTLDEWAQQLPIGRPALPREIAEVIVALAGPAGAYIVGEDINIDGGLAMR